MSILCVDVIPKEFFNQISKGKKSFSSEDLFSFMLKLPVIFSTNDTQTIVSGFQLAKGGNDVVFSDFE